MDKHDVIIVGAGPCGMSCAIELQNKGIESLLIEKGNIANSIYNYPTHQTFFSSSEKLEIGDVAFITPRQKPVRLDALAYYRSVASRKALNVHSFERVYAIKKDEQGFIVQSITDKGVKQIYHTKHVVIATGYYDQPNNFDIPGADLPKVMHYFKEGHPYYDRDVVVIGGKNSAVDAALELHKAGARVTVIYRGSAYSESVKPWILPQFDSLVKNEEIHMIFESEVTNITEDEVFYSVNGEVQSIPNDYVFAMIGYKPDLSLLQQLGVQIDLESGKPFYSEETYETNISGIYIAGVVAAGFNNNAIFIENGRFHGVGIANSIALKINGKNT